MGKGGVVFWFVFEDLAQSYPFFSAPQYAATDADAVCQAVAHLQISPDIRFREIYANRIVARKIVLEEGMAKTWHAGRAVIVGDAAHKVPDARLCMALSSNLTDLAWQMVPNAAMGANQALESAVVLVNELQGVLAASSDKTLHRDGLRSALERFEEQRRGRTGEVIQKAGIICRAQLVQ